MSTPVRGRQAPGLAYHSGQGRWVLAATILGSGIAQLDATVVNVALPRIGANLHAGLTSLQWILNAYTLTLSGLLLLGGSLGDRMGRRRIFVVGVVWFAIASAGCSFAPTAAVLIAMRALQGVGGALLTPGSLAILEAVFRHVDGQVRVAAMQHLGEAVLGEFNGQRSLAVGVPGREKPEKEAADPCEVELAVFRIRRHVSVAGICHPEVLLRLNLSGVAVPLCRGPVQAHLHHRGNSKTAIIPA